MLTRLAVFALASGLAAQTYRPVVIGGNGSGGTGGGGTPIVTQPSTISVNFIPGWNQNSYPDGGNGKPALRNTPLDAIGTANWAAFNAVSGFDRKAGAPAITYSVIGQTPGTVGAINSLASGAFDTAPANSRASQWLTHQSWTSGGSVHASQAVSANAIYAYNNNSTGTGFTISIPIPQTPQRNIIRVGTFHGDSVLTARLSDSSATPVSDASMIRLLTDSQLMEGWYEIDTVAGSPGVSLLVDFVGNTNSPNIPSGQDPTSDAAQDPRYDASPYSFVAIEGVMCLPTPTPDAYRVAYAVLSDIRSIAQVPVSVPPGGITVHNVGLMDDFQTLLNNYIVGDEYLFPDGYHAIGNFIVPAKTVAYDGGGNPKFTYFLAGSQSLASGQRITPEEIHVTIETQNTGPALANCWSGAGCTEGLQHMNHVRFDGFEFIKGETGANLSYAVVWINTGSDAGYTFTRANAPDGLQFTHCSVRGPEADTNIQRGIVLEGANVLLADSWISNIRYDTVEAAGVTWINTIGPTTVVNNFVESAGENIISSGIAPSVPWGSLNNYYVAGNYLFKRPEWLFRPVFSGQTRGPDVKNIFEIKTGFNAWVRRNLMEWNWSDAQTGIAVLFTPRQSPDGLSASSPYSGDNGIIFEENTVRYSTGGVSAASWDNYSGGYVSNQVTTDKSLTITSNLFDQLSLLGFGYGNQSGNSCYQGDVDYVNFTHNNCRFDNSLGDAGGRLTYSFSRSQHYGSIAHIDHNELQFTLGRAASGGKSALPYGATATFNNNTLSKMDGSSLANWNTNIQIDNPALIAAHAGNQCNGSLCPGESAYPSPPTVGADLTALAGYEATARTGNRPTMPRYELALATTPPSITQLHQSGSITIGLNQIATNGMSAASTVMVWGLPAGVTASWSTGDTAAAPSGALTSRNASQTTTLTGTASTTLTLTASSSAATFGPHAIVIETKTDIHQIRAVMFTLQVLP